MRLTEDEIRQAAYGVQVRAAGRMCTAKGQYGPCSVASWAYEMEGQHPRMYGVCVHCQTLYAVTLPRSVNEQGRRFAPVLLKIGDRYGWNQEPVEVSAIAAAALSEEYLFGSDGRGRWMLPSGAPSSIAESTIISLVRKLERSVEARLEQIDDLTRLVYRRLGELEGMQRDLRRKILRKHVLGTRKRGDVICDGAEECETVYALVDPRDRDRVRYVGKSSSPVARYRQHCDRGEPVVREWVDALRLEGVRPMMILLEQCTDNEVYAREAYWIAEYRKEGMADLNRHIPKREGGA